MGRKLRLLDLYCGSGGASKGYHEAGFEVVGVDIVPKPDYPFEFIESDALEFPLEGFDAVHASPPCQRWVSAAYNGSERTKSHYLNHISPMRKKLSNSDLPYVIENVQGAPLIDPLILCGTFFPELRVLRHRLFESNIQIPQPDLTPCEFHPPVYTRDKRSKNYGKLDPSKDFVTVFGNSSIDLKNGSEAMGIDWMKKKDLVQAIPPAYTKYIGKHLITYLETQASSESCL